MGSMRRLVRIARRRPGLIVVTVTVGALLAGVGVATWQGGAIVRLMVTLVGFMFVQDLAMLVAEWIEEWRQDKRVQAYVGTVHLDYWPAHLKVDVPYPHLTHDAEEPDADMGDDAA